MKTLALILTASLLIFLSLGCTSSKELSATVNPPQKELTETADTLSAAEEKARQQKKAEEKLKAELEEKYKQLLYNRHQSRANGLTTYYILAQQQFYARQYNNAMYLIEKAASFKETPDVMALRGNIYLALGQKDKFAQEWRKALELDPDIPIPSLPFITNELKNQGLINDSYNRNFR